jgi:hypothetical protein
MVRFGDDLSNIEVGMSEFQASAARMRERQRSSTQMALPHVVVMAFGVAMLIPHMCCAAEGKKKLIEFGWDEPSPSFMRQHVAEMERAPFDGCVFHVDFKTPAGKSGSFTWDAWSKRPHTDAELQNAIDDLKATQFKKFKYNFLRFNTTPGDLDWFDDYSAIVNNARLAARVAKEGGCAGILFDIEQYNGQLFGYQKMRDAKTKSWDVYAAQARKRGREVMEAFQDGYPDVTIFLTFGYCLPWAQTGGKRPLSDASYGLLAPMLDGMVEAAHGKTRLVDGHELSYSYKDSAQFTAAYRTMQIGLLPIVADHEKYPKVFSLGFGIWLDHDWRKEGWNETDFSKNHFTPTQFEASVRKALETSDEYVWIYSETPRWWSNEGTSVKLPPAYDEAIRRARKGLAAE